MRAMIVGVMLSALAQGAWAQSTAQDNGQTNASRELQAAPGAPSGEDLAAAKKLQSIARELEAAGFKDIQFVPQAVLVAAKDQSDKPVMMVVDTLSMIVVQLESPQDSGTTGSGSSDERKPEE